MDLPSNVFTDERDGMMEWEGAMHELPSQLAAGCTRRCISSLPPFPLGSIQTWDSTRLWRAQQVLSFLSHAFIWLESPHSSELPAHLAVPWVAVSKALDMPPILTYSTYNLINWRKIDAKGPIELGNICCLFNFYGGIDEEHFRLVHVAIEASAGHSISRLVPMVEASEAGNEETVLAGLNEISQTLVKMQQILSQMGEKCDPYIYYHRVRLPMSGWKSNQSMPNGLLYSGVSTERVQLYGETGAQSSIVPAFDAALGIVHERGWLSDYLLTMESHMPPAHRAFVRDLRGRGNGLRSLCTQRDRGMREAYNETVNELEKFRRMHKGFASKYIAVFSSKDKGTGGSDFMPALSAYQKTTGSAQIPLI
jgi:indoleamine 2,3-dioxygenase